MSMSMSVYGIKPPDEKWIKMKAIWDSCSKAGIDLPSEVFKFFDHEPPDDAGVLVDLAQTDFEWKDDMEEGYEIDLSKIDGDIKKIRFICSY